MAINRDPILKKCRTLGISPGVLGYSKETRRDPKRNARRAKSSGTRFSCVKSRRPSSSTAFWKSSSALLARARACRATGSNC